MKEEIKRNILKGIHALNVGIEFFPRTINSIGYQLKKTKLPTRKYKLGIVTIIKNEGDYISEWLQYHKIIGIQRIYIYDNESTDNTKEIIEKYVAQGIVKYHLIKGKGMQLKAYNDAIKKYKNECEYLAFIDGDEFLVPNMGNKNINDIVKEIFAQYPKAGGLAVNWQMFGSSGYECKQEGGVIETFLYKAQWGAAGTYCIKTIADPRKVFKYKQVHYPQYLFPYYNVDESGRKIKGPYNSNQIENPRIMINHYFTKSKEEWVRRRNLGMGDDKSGLKRRSIEEFYKHDNNDIFDDTALKCKFKDKI